VNHLEQERLAARDSEALEVQRGRAGLEAEGGSDALAGGLGSCGQQAGLRIEASALHLLGEAQRVGDADVEPGLEDERAAAAGALQALLSGKLVERSPDGDEAAAVPLRELTLGREAIPGLPLALVEGGLQVEVDLVVQRDGAGVETEARHGSPVSSSDSLGWP
jgi:hypothetical protein